jgi:hypothetical protein
VTESQNDLAQNLTDSIQDLGKAMEDMKDALTECRKAGMNDADIRDLIVMNLPEEDRPAFMSQWPMISLMFNAL